ncbi:MAG: protein kinase [Deltaproteobacteria bacterium]|nr:protein kinase [Deltaproteobacteria bacterium]
MHRDVKPGNVLVSRAGLAKLTDFGIARLEDAQVTREGILLGTPSYMSPEQLAGRRGAEIDGRSDLYSLAVVIYELVARKHPHGIKPKSDIYDIIRIKNEQDPAPLTVEGAEELAPLLARALARRPEDRFASAGEMAVALKRVAASKRALKDELARRVAAAARASAARNRRKRAPHPGTRSRTCSPRHPGAAMLPSQWPAPRRSAWPRVCGYRGTPTPQPGSRLPPSERSSTP